MKKKVFCMMLTMVMVFLLTACGGKNATTTPDAAPTAEPGVTVTLDATPTPDPTPSPTATPVPDNAWYDEMIARSLLSTGNNFRLRKVIEKAKSGEDVYIGFIGGSITEGEGTTYQKCYAMQAAQKFADLYGTGSNIHMINAGVSGTPSTLGVIRYERDLIEKNDGHKPDLLIIEFAVNDGDDPTNGQTYEGLIRRALYEDNEPAVILLFSVFKSKWNLQDRCKPIGAHYELPMVSIKDAVVPCLNNGKITSAQFFNDEYHPKLYGHTIMAECLEYLFRKVMEEEPSAADTPKKDPLKSSAFDNVHLITAKSSNVKVNAGDFSATDTAVGTTRYDNQKTFEHNWKHEAAAGTRSLTFTVNAKSILLTYKKSKSKTYGSVDVYVDGTKVTTINGYDAGGWNNPYTAVILNTDKVASHKVEVKMAAGSEDKDFTIMAFGYGD